MHKGFPMNRLWLGIAGVGVAAGMFVAGTTRPVHAKDSVTFAEDVAPIVFNHCTTCHRPGEAAPFTLMNYQDVKSHAKLIASVTGLRRMPPWKAGPSDYAFKADRRLTDEQIPVFQKWIDAGMPEGDAKKVPPMPAFTEGWQLGKPDLVVSMPQAFDVPAYGRDIYRNFVLPLNLTEDKWVKAIDFRPSARAVVHHSLFFLDSSGTARALDAQDGRPGFAGAMGGGVAVARGAAGRVGTNDLLAMLMGRRGPGDTSTEPVPDIAEVSSQITGGLGGWALGGQPRELPDDLAYFVPKGSDLILSTHFHPSGKAEKEASVVGLYFTNKAPTKKFTGIQLPPLFGAVAGVEIPAGEKHFVIQDSFVLPVDVKAFGTGAHAHYIGKEMKLTATLPNGDVKKLLWIEDWDFAWQEQYAYSDYVLLPKGTRLDGLVSYDNSADNPRNPSSPPRRVTWGEQSTDEMGSVGLQVVAANSGDMPVLQAAYADHVREKARAFAMERIQCALIEQGRGRGRGQR